MAVARTQMRSLSRSARVRRLEQAPGLSGVRKRGISCRPKTRLAPGRYKPQVRSSDDLGERTPSLGDCSVMHLPEDVSRDGAWPLDAGSLQAPRPGS
jgi:hypothetical protein